MFTYVIYTLAKLNKIKNTNLVSENRTVMKLLKYTTKNVKVSFKIAIGIFVVYHDK